MDLSAEEMRVLGCLVEKQRTVPDTYPLSLNALRTACNQTTNRDPVVTYDESAIEAALDRLRARAFVRRGVTAGSRVIKYWQLFDEALGLDDAETALLGVLMLRGPQTAGELKGRAERLHRFDTLDDVVATLDRLAVREEPLVERLTREPGRKEPRYAHRLGDTAADGREAGESRAEPEWSAPPRGDLEDLRDEVRALRADVEELRDRIDRLGG